MLYSKTSSFEIGKIEPKYYADCKDAYAMHGDLFSLEKRENFKPPDEAKFYHTHWNPFLQFIR